MFHLDSPWGSMCAPSVGLKITEVAIWRVKNKGQYDAIFCDCRGDKYVRKICTFSALWAQYAVAMGMPINTIKQGLKFILYRQFI